MNPTRKARCTESDLRRGYFERSEWNRNIVTIYYHHGIKQFYLDGYLSTLRSLGERVYLQSNSRYLPIRRLYNKLAREIAEASAKSS